MKRKSELISNTREYLLKNYVPNEIKNHLKQIETKIDDYVKLGDIEIKHSIIFEKECVKYDIVNGVIDELLKNGYYPIVKYTGSWVDMTIPLV